MSEIKPVKETLDTLIDSPQAIEFSFGEVDYDKLFSSDTVESLLSRIQDGLHSLITAAKTSTESERENDNIDERVLSAFEGRIKVNKRISSPIMEFFSLTTTEMSDNSPIGVQLKKALDALIHSLDVTMSVLEKRDLDAVDGERERRVIGEKTVSLSYDQYVALIELYSLSIVSALQCGSNNERECVSMFVHPTVSFILQLNRLLSQYDRERDTEGERDDDEDSALVRRARESLDFAVKALDKLHEAKTVSEESGDLHQAIEILSDGLLDELLNDEERETDTITVPIYLHVQLLLAR